MPNHITNRIRVIADPYTIWKINQLVFSLEDPADLSKGYYFDFNKIKPMPESLRGNFLEADVRHAKGLYTPWPITNREHVDTMKQNLEQYGYAYWCDFCIQEWGTKWNSYENYRIFGKCSLSFLEEAEFLADQLIHNSHEDAKKYSEDFRNGDIREEDIIIFNTAWNCPKPIFIQLSILFQTAIFQIEYADENMWSNCGTLICLQGDYEYVKPQFQQQFSKRILKNDKLRNDSSVL